MTSSSLSPIVSILAETEEIKAILKDKGIDVETIAEVYPIRVQPARILSHIYSSLGKEIGQAARIKALFNTGWLPSFLILHDCVLLY